MKNFPLKIKKPIGRKTRLEVMEQRQNKKPELKTRHEKQKEIMSIPDRQARLNAIARNKELFTGKKAR